MGDCSSSERERESENQDGYCVGEMAFSGFSSCWVQPREIPELGQLF